MSLSKELHQHGVPAQTLQRKGPLWRGPEQDGITFSLLSRFLACRERFRLYVVEGLAPPDSFNHRLEYGNMWHLCEEAYAATSKACVPSSRALPWESDLNQYARHLCQRYPIQQEQIVHWANVCRIQFPLYVDHWSQLPSRLLHPGPQRKPLLQEQTFDVPYRLPSGRTVRLRGKWDSVDLVGGDKNAAIWLQENKTKADIDQQRIARQLRFDLQTMLYLVALKAEQGNSFWRRANKAWRNLPIAGVRYNVVRRPLSGGRHTIKRHEPTKKNPLGESSVDFYRRLGGLIQNDPTYFFMRWNVEISTQDIEVFRRTCLDPILEQLCAWWDWVNVMNNDPFHVPEKFIEETSYGVHYRFPYGVYNPTLEGNTADLDAYLETGSRIGLRQVDNLFPELPE